MLTGGYNVAMATKQTKPPGRRPHSAKDKLVKKQVGMNLVRAREAMGLEQAHLASALQTSVSNLNKYECGVSFPTPEIFMGLAEWGISMDFLFTGLGRPLTRPIDISEMTSLRRKVAGS